MGDLIGRMIMSRGILLTLGMLMALASWAAAHDVPVELPAPQSVGEAWNVIQQSKANIDQLVDANLMRDIGAQLANISGALRFLQSNPASDQPADKVRDLCGKLMSDEVDLLRRSRLAADAPAQTKSSWSDWKKTLGQLETCYPDSTVHAEVFICPMHPQDRHLKADEKCSICGMSLVRRHLPATGVYQKPGEATLKLAVQAPPLQVGKSASVTIRLTKSNGSPVVLDNLIETHMKKIHLLIDDGSLSDYHHEHPQPTTRPGEYAFAFTPSKPGPYRIWADVVPAETGMQEYLIADLPADSQSLPLSDRSTRLTGELNGRRYELTFDTQANPITANQTILGTIAIRDSNGNGFNRLEPIMGAFAHLVAFNEDHKTVLHIHPYGQEPKGPNDHAGPVFAFKFYAPVAGFYRLYCQVQIDGQQQFVPFNLTVQSAK